VQSGIAVYSYSPNTNILNWPIFVRIRIRGVFVIFGTKRIIHNEHDPYRIRSYSYSPNTNKFISLFVFAGMTLRFFQDGLSVQPLALAYLRSDLENWWAAYQSGRSAFFINMFVSLELYWNLSSDPVSSFKSATWPISSCANCILMPGR
jgi:hypothetical protein